MIAIKPAEEMRQLSQYWERNRNSEIIDALIKACYSAILDAAESGVYDCYVRNDLFNNHDILSAVVKVFVEAGYHYHYFFEDKYWKHGCLRIFWRLPGEDGR